LPAEEKKWSFSLEPMFLDVYGHDRHVLTIHEIDLGASPPVDTETAVRLETDAGIAYRAGIQYASGPWVFGLDYFLLLTAQSADDITAAAGGAVDRAFEMPNRTFLSTDPSEILFYGVLEDTDLEMWTLDLYALRKLSESAGGSLSLQVGVRFGDFDNDYHAVAGVQGIEGRRVDASSNYGRMTGPLLGMSASIAMGRSSLHGYIGQSVIFGSAELSRTVGDFQGPFSENPAFVSQGSFHADDDVAIPITELRLSWVYGLSDVFSLGAGVHTSTWWNVPVPPGVVPLENGSAALDENTLTLFGVMGIVKVRL
jgi:hypothetical protein